MPRALGRYELLRPLARGGMAEVYLARRRAAGIEKWLVVKRMRPERSGDPRFLDLFVREARLSMSLVHQNIVPVFDFGRIDEEVFLAMERVEGRDLGSSLARAAGHRLPPLLAAFVAAECCQALDYAHQRKGPDGVALGIVHRDVTPRNVLLSWSGEVKLTDFGIAALAGEATSRLLGTPQYMAPEQARSEPIDPRADIYAIGLILREALTGTRPRPGSDRDAILEAARRGALLPWPRPSAPPPPPELALGSGDHGPADEPRNLAPELVAIADRATATTAGDRYPDARAMLADLDHYIVGERARNKAESPAHQLAAWLDAVWRGAREEIEADAAIDAEHLVSFLDDGAFDVIGTGTVRSQLATAAEESGANAAPVPGPRGVPAQSTPAPLAPSAATPAPTPAPTRRSTRISSANTTVASGSIQTSQPPVARSDGQLSAPAPRRSRTPIAVASIATVAAVAIGAIVFRASRSERAVTGSPAAGSQTTAQPAVTTAQPADRPASDAASPAGPPGPARPAGPSTPTPGRTTARPPGSSTSRPSTAEHPPARPSGANQSPAGPSTGRSSTSGSSPAKRMPSSADRAATCRVRINLIPWAYYTVDHDATRHETPGTIDLAPGEHRLHVWNPELEIERDITINVPSDRDTMNFSEPLKPSTLAP